MTQNRSPTSPTPFRGKPPFYLCGSFDSCRRWGDEYQPGATPGHSAILQGEVIHMADKTQVQVREVKQLLRELLKISGMSETSIKLGITYIQGLSDGEATQTSTKA
jgi:hypothetical protein